MIPNFTAYFRFEQLPNEVKERHRYTFRKLETSNPRFDLLLQSGYYEPFQKLTNKHGQLFFQLLRNTDGVIQCEETRLADFRLQAKNSLNLSSVYLLETQRADGYLVGFGNPLDSEFYGKENFCNPFYKQYVNDGFIFLIEPNYKSIEMLVIPNGKNTIMGNAQGLSKGFYDETLDTIRKSAKVFFMY